MASEAISSRGTLMRIGNGATPTEIFETIAEVKDITGPSISLETEDVTNHSSPGAYNEVIATVLSAGDVSFEISFVPDHPTHSATSGLIKDQQDRTLRNFEIIFPTAIPVTWAFSAFITGFEVSAPVAGILGASVTLTITGQPTLA